MACREQRAVHSQELLREPVTYDDAGKEGTRYFVNIVSAGMGGLVDKYVATASRALGGGAAYFGASSSSSRYAAMSSSEALPCIFCLVQW